MALNINEPYFASMRKAIQYGYDTNNLHGLAIKASVGPRCNNNPNDVEVVSWLLFFYFQIMTQTMTNRSDVNTAYVDHKLNCIMNHPTKYTADHEWFIKSFQKTIKENVTGIIAPQSIEHIILSYEILGYASMIGDYDCKGVLQYIDDLNPHQTRNEVIATSVGTLAILAILFSRSLRGEFTETLLIALAKKKIPENIRKQMGSIVEGGIDKLSFGSYSKVKLVNDGINNMQNPALKRLFQIGLITIGSAGVATYMYYANNQCKANLNSTISDMNADIDNWKRKYDEEVLKNQTHVQDQKQIQELRQQQQEFKQQQQELQRELQEILKKKNHSFNRTLTSHMQNIAYLKDNAIHSGKYWC